MLAMNRRLAALAFSISVMTAGIITGSFAQDNSWNGTWNGRWAENNTASSIVIVKGRVQEYRYGNQVVPIQQQSSRADSITFGCTTSCPPYSIVLTRTDSARAIAAFSSPRLASNRAEFSRK